MARREMTKLSLSKKGFDTENGGSPSPILPDGRMVSLPIPEPRTGASSPPYEQLTLDGGSLIRIMRRAGCNVAADAAAHVDPDLVEELLPREQGWRGMFGQVDSAEAHLANQGMGSGALFLFWGWFAPCQADGTLTDKKGFSAIFGYLEVDYVLAVGTDAIPDFVQHHPHVDEAYPRQRNRIYVARERLSWNPARPGWGVFRYDPQLRLSTDASRSQWRLPRVFHPDNGCELSYCTVTGPPGEQVDVQVPGRGQEFVCEMSPEIAAWARQLIDRTEIWSPRAASRGGF